MPSSAPLSQRPGATGATSHDVPSASDLAELRDQVETFAAQQFSGLAQTVAETASQTAVLRGDLRRGLMLIDTRIAEDRWILGQVQYQVDAVESHRGQDHLELATLQSDLAAHELQVAGVRDQSDSRAQILHSEIVSVATIPVGAPPGAPSALLHGDARAP